jgi:hypothetical protein
MPVYSKENLLMISIWTFISFTHLIGLALGVGAATVKLALLYRCNSDISLIPVFIRIAKPVTQIIILGLILLTLSGIGWILMGTIFTTLFIVKLILVGLIWILGPYMDNAVAPVFVKLAPAPGQEPGQEFIRIQKKYFLLEALATVLFYVITIFGVLL